MPKTIRRIYWDASAFMAYINEVPDRVAEVEAMLAEARRGEIQIITSVLTIAEVALAESEILGRALDPAIEAKIDALWAPGSPVQLVEAHQIIAEKARELQRNGATQGWTGLRSMDAMHLATAQHEGVDEVHTYDSKWPKYAPAIGCPISRPFASTPQLGLGPP
jgi:predicted nucleic acid-binding protein